MRSIQYRPILWAAACLPGMIIASASLAPANAQDQPTLRNARSGAMRFELGRRTQILEQEWISCTDPERRMLAVPQVNTAVGAFFASQVQIVVKSMAEATATLRDEQRTPVQQWADALHVSGAPRLTSTDAADLQIQLDWMYQPPIDRPELNVQIRLAGTSQVLLDQACTADSQTVACSIPVTDVEADTGLIVSINASDNSTVREFELGLSRVNRLTERLTALQTTLDRETEEDASLEITTARYLTGLLQERASGTIHETDYPSLKLLREAEMLAAATAPVPPREGEYYVAVPNAGRTIPVRVMVPQVDTDVVVIAVHGAGGTENMFFEAYGDGMIVKMCRERGWTLISPTYQSPLDDVWTTTDLVESVVTKKPRHRFLVGHSMGAMTGLRMGQAKAERLSGLAAISGGARGDLSPLVKLPVFLSAGNYDFGKSGTTAAAAALKKLEAPVTVRMYDAEHLLIVPDALPDVFAWMDQIVADAAD